MKLISRKKNCWVVGCIIQKRFSTYEEVDDEHGDGDDDGGVESNNDRGQRPLRPLLRLTFAF